MQKGSMEKRKITTGHAEKKQDNKVQEQDCRGVAILQRYRVPTQSQIVCT